MEDQTLHISKDLIDSLPVVVFEYTFFQDGNKDFTYLSPRCEELLGVDPKVLLRGILSMESFIHPEDWMNFQTSISMSLGSMTEWRWKGRCRGKQGFIWIDAQGNPLRAADGRIIYRGIFSDITEQKHLEHQFQELVNQLPIGIVIHHEGALRFSNEFACRLVGAASPDELIGLPIRKFVHESFWAEVEDRTFRAMRGEHTPAAELKYVRLDGTSFEVEATAHPYLLQGKPAVQVIFSDITDRRKAEATIRKTETLFYQLFQSTPLAVTLLNEQGQVVQINRGFYELFGFDQAELVNKSLNEFIVPRDRMEEGDTINRLISNKQVVRLETQRHRKDGKILSVIIYGVPVQQEDQTLGIFGMYVDITERNKVEEELRVRNVELDNFVYKVSHDLRAPLSSVLGLTYLAGLPGNHDNLLDYINLIGQKARQLDRFISDVLSHSKNLKMELKTELVDFKKIIEDSINDLRYLNGADTVRNVATISGSDFYSDTWRIGEIFRNLVSNAIKYRRIDREETVLMLNVSVDSFRCLITFSDNGIGIDPERRTKIFDMFYRASDQSEGSGLGLYIVQNAIEKLGGTVEVESELGMGTTFKISLPNHQLSK